MMESLTPKKERAKRIKRSFTARFRVLRSDFAYSTKWNIVTVKNLSSSGIFFSHNEEMPIGTGIELNISLPFINKPANCLGKVCRIDEDRQYKAGLRKIPVFGIAAHFDVIDDDIKEAIDNFAENLDIQK